MIDFEVYFEYTFKSKGSRTIPAESGPEAEEKVRAMLEVQPPLDEVLSEEVEIVDIIPIAEIDE